MSWVRFCTRFREAEIHREEIGKGSSLVYDELQLAGAPAPFLLWSEKNKQGFAPWLLREKEEGEEE
jgi:hypothetical protein